MMKHPIQSLVDAIGESEQRARQGTGMTVGKLLAKLEGIPDETPLGPPLGFLHSYRGFYCDLAFDEIVGFRQSDDGDYLTAGALREALTEAIGATYEGYKGGDYTMARTTPLWVAPWGCTGKRVLSVAVGTKVAITTGPEPTMEWCEGGGDR